MKYFPLGEIDQDRSKLSEKYNLIECIDGIHRLTEKCRKNYDELSYIKYLRGELSQPEKIGKESVIQELLAL